MMTMMMILLIDDVGSARTVKFDAAETEYVLRELNPGSTYRLRMKSLSFVGESNFTDFVDASVLPSGKHWTLALPAHSQIHT